MFGTVCSKHQFEFLLPHIFITIKQRINKKKVLVKILMCSCYAEKFHEEENVYEKKLCHFHCKCKNKHHIFILTWEKHLYVVDNIPNMEPRCTCPILDPDEICNFLCTSKTSS